LVALAEMAMAGGMGATVAIASEAPPHAILFGEDQARYIMVTAAPEAVAADAARAGIALQRLGLTGGDALTVAGAGAISVSELRRINEAWLPAYMGA
jgi:phosphoribosylformylglycinamidine synthase